MSQAMLTASDESDRIVCGYTRIHCENYVPAPLVELIRRFYNLWIHRCFSKDEIATLRTLKRNDTVAFALPNAKFMLNGSTFDCYLQVRCFYNHKDEFGQCGELVRYHLILKAALPGDIEFISCVVKTNGPVYTLPRWKRVHTRDGEIYGDSGLYHLDVIELDRLQPTLPQQCWGLSDTISIHVDIKQIKYTPEAQQPDIDAWEVAKNGKWHWKHTGLTDAKLSEINTTWNYALFRIERTMLALPINVSALNMKVVAKGNIGEMYFEIETIMFLNGKMIRKRTDMDDFEHPMKLEIDMEIVKVFDLREQEINEDDWSKHGVSSHINVPSVFNITP